MSTTRPATAGPAHAAAPITVRDITKSFGGPPVLDGVGLDVAPGELVALLGPSGCGKTTLLRIIAGLEVPDTGEVVVRDTVLTSATVSVAPERRHVGMVFQDWALFPHLTVAKNVAYGVARDANRAERVRDALAMVELDGLDDRLPSTLSGGQQQRVALARAIAPQPDVLLLDEPFSNLDTALRVQVRSDLHRLLVDLGITTVFVTHDQEEAFVLGDRVAVMNAGHVLQAAAPAEIYRSPATRWVAGFVGDANFLPAGTARAAAPARPAPVEPAPAAGPVEVATAVGTLPLVAGADGDAPFEVLVRPEDLDLDPGGTAVVELVEFHGHDTVYLVRLDATTTVRVRVGAAPRYARHDAVTVRYTGPEVVAFPLDPTAATGSIGTGAEATTFAGTGTGTGGGGGATGVAGDAVHAIEAGLDPAGEAVTDR